MRSSGGLSQGDAPQRSVPDEADLQLRAHRIEDGLIAEHCESVDWVRAYQSFGLLPADVKDGSLDQADRDVRDRSTRRWTRNTALLVLRLATGVLFVGHRLQKLVPPKYSPPLLRALRSFRPRPTDSTVWACVRRSRPQSLPGRLSWSAAFHRGRTADPDRDGSRRRRQGRGLERQGASRE